MQTFEMHWKINGVTKESWIFWHEKWNEHAIDCLRKWNKMNFSPLELSIADIEYNND